ncbi:glycosyltransferase family 2 protein [Streptomyces kaniharaensis]|uniref:glycosyltransferase family 2 protein n=1 Tax=Streptomyces kaniharaensis TaxID=212423 RepID=UPI002DDD9C9D|nr:glycosyltransferase family 2 protein [Streptomyces kaniharaensis]
MDSTNEHAANRINRGRGRHGRVLPRARHERRLLRRDLRNTAAQRAYVACAETTGPLTAGEDGAAVRYRSVSSRGVKFVMTVLVAANALAGLAFVGWLLLPEHIPGSGVGWSPDWRVNLARICFCAVVTVEVIRLVQNLAVWVFAFRAKDPVPVTPPPGLKVAVLTTIVPSKEPIEIVERTLRAMLRIEYDGQIDVWILDEGDDDRVKEMAARLGVHHFSRKGRPEYNQAEGEFRAKTKSGNHNSWRAEHEHGYDVVAQMDPDHVPLPCFLERTLGYFHDPDVAFVVAPQVYGNMYDNWVAHGASVQQYLFSGLVERGGNGMDAPLLIGTNHLYRPTAWQQIGGYQDSIIEDHLTSMRIQASVNPGTGHRWKGVYTPDVLAVGEGPTSWTDYFNQQKRWAYGIWEILLKSRLRSGIKLRLRQRVLYGLVQFYYPSVAVNTVLGSLATSVYLALGVTSIHLNSTHWMVLWGASMGSWFVLWLWLRRFNLAAHERREIGTAGMGLALFAGPVYVAAAGAALLRRPLAYAVTAKGDLRSAESLSTFRLHLMWAAVAGGLLGASFTLHHDIWILRFWAGVSLFTGVAPLVISFVSGRREAHVQQAAAARAAEYAEAYEDTETSEDTQTATTAESAETAEASETAEAPESSVAGHLPSQRTNPQQAEEPDDDEFEELLEPARAGGRPQQGAR